MEVYRLSREIYARPLNGKGAAIKGARWNPIGVELIYSASNRSLAMAEVAVHLTMATLPGDYVMTTIFVPDDISIERVLPVDLPVNWNSFPYSTSTHTIGEKFVNKGTSCILKVPSAVTRGDFNFLINPAHKDFRRIKIVEIIKFPFDNRIFK
ncbi:MAG: RES domain-containing protein [Chitinophagaceae bacterium]